MKNKSIPFTLRRYFSFNLSKHFMSTVIYLSKFKPILNSKILPYLQDSWQRKPGDINTNTVLFFVFQKIPANKNGRLNSFLSLKILVHFLMFKFLMGKAPYLKCSTIIALAPQHSSSSSAALFPAFFSPV